MEYYSFKINVPRHWFNIINSKLKTANINFTADNVILNIQNYLIY